MLPFDEKYTFKSSENLLIRTNIHANKKYRQENGFTILFLQKKHVQMPYLQVFNLKNFIFIFNDLKMKNITIDYS
jgi:hypothetical protein